MVSCQRITIVLVACTILFLFFPKEAASYLDPGTGSYVFQLLLAGLFGALFTIKLFWHRIKSFFRAIFSRGVRHEKNEEL